jgi:dipeptidyl aminopeptidase/acylaminoacyl peptidase
MNHPAHSGSVAFKYKGLKLVGVLARPAGPERKKFPAVLFLHGFPGSEQNVDVRRRLLEQGVASFALHFSGAWGSDGYYAFSNLVPQAQAALKYLASCDFVDKKRLAVFGFSMGGWTAINLSARAPSLKAIVAVAPVGGPEMTRGLTRAHIAHHAKTLRIKSVNALFKDFGDSVTALDPAKAAFVRAMPLLLVHGTADDVVPCAISKRIYGAAKRPAKLVVSSGARHDFLDRRGWLTSTCAGFLKRYL